MEGVDKSTELWRHPANGHCLLSVILVPKVMDALVVQNCH